MPENPSYPGIYIEENSNGARAIRGVSTSVTAFIGASGMETINQAMQVFSLSEFELNFGGVSPCTELRCAMRQFFSNGGSGA
jgi:phage tail sheath protein FI